MEIHKPKVKHKTYRNFEKRNCGIERLKSMWLFLCPIWYNSYTFHSQFSRREQELFFQSCVSRQEHWFFLSILFLWEKMRNADNAEVHTVRKDSNFFLHFCVSFGFLFLIIFVCLNCKMATDADNCLVSEFTYGGGGEGGWLGMKTNEGIGSRSLQHKKSSLTDRVDLRNK